MRVCSLVRIVEPAWAFATVVLGSWAQKTRAHDLMESCLGTIFAFRVAASWLRVICFTATVLEFVLNIQSKKAVGYMKDNDEEARRLPDRLVAFRITETGRRLLRGSLLRRVS